MKKLFFLILVLGSQVVMAQNLLNAIKNKDISLAKKMIRQGENVNQRDSNGATLLMWAVLKTDLTFCKYLIKKGADSKLKGVIYTDSTRSQYYGNILGICALNNHYDWLEWFVKHEKIPVDDRELNLADNTETGWTALQYAVYKGDEAGVNKLIKLSANRNYISPNDSANMLLEAINYGHSDLAKKILGFTGINLNHSNIVGYNALHYAVFLNNYTVAEALLKAGIPVNSQSDSLITPLHAAITSYLPQMVGLIMQYFPDTSLTNKWGETPDLLPDIMVIKGSLIY
jgi:serine/threonine-protein phosphatase 6 regulatory ankyrin repeat subunit B